MNQPTPLTRYPVGSIRELWTISLPLMISTLASLFMIFTDRIFLSRYSVEALNATVNSGSLAWAFMAGVGMVTAMSEIFVAQYNGSKQFSRLGKPVWQMIWLSLLSFLVFIPLATWGAPLIFGDGLYADLEIVYFRWLMLFSPGYALMTAFAGFFIGRGKTKIMIVVAIVANCINIILDWLLIFGVPGWIPEFGIQGAAIATCTGYLFESAALAYLFLSKENRKFYGTADWGFDWKELKKCLRVGIPQGVFCFLEILGWAVFYWMMTSLSEEHITISSICQSFAILLSFFCEGLSRGSAAVAGNLIGAKNPLLVKKVLRSGFILLLLFSMTTSLFLVVDPVDTVRVLFFSHFEGVHLTAGVGFSSGLQDSLKICMIFTFIYMFFDGLRWVFSGMLVAAGDTLFLLITGSLSVWVFLLAPVYFVVVRYSLPVEYAWGFTMVYGALFFLLYWIRFKRGAWQRLDLIKSENNKPYTPPEMPAPTLADRSE